MKKITSAIPLLLLFALTFVMMACDSIDKQARDVSASLKGPLVVAQQQNQDKCGADPSVQPCQLINRAISAQNALITADQAYCGWSKSTALDQRDVPCVPVKTAEGGLKSALANAQPFIQQLKGVIH